MQITVLFEDKDFLVIDKPAGLVVHSDGKTKEESLSDWLIAKYPAKGGYPGIEKVGEPIKLASGETIWKPGLVHRLDRETSGVLLIAKNQEAYLFAKEQFQERTTRKIYHAFVYGDMKIGEGITAKVDRPIGRSINDFRKWTAERGTRGETRDAVTEYKLLKRGKGPDGTRGAGGESGIFSYLEVHPLTGRTHQIRVHMKAINHPVVADKLYAPNRAGVPAENLGFERLALHAISLEFTLLNGKKKTVEAPLPSDFKKALKLLK